MKPLSVESQISSAPVGLRAVASNFSWLVADKAVRVVLNVAVSVWIARFLGPEQFGLLSYSMAAVTLVAGLVDLGLEGLVKRELLQHPEQMRRLLSTAWGLRLGAGTCAYIAMLASLSFDWVGPAERTLMLIFGLTFFQPALVIADLAFQARLQARDSVVVQLAALMIGASVRIGLILTGAPVVGFAWAAVVEMIVAGILFGWRARVLGIDWGCRSIHMETARRLLRDAWPLLLSSAAVLIYTRLDAIMVRHLAGQEAVGIYSAAVRFSEIWYFLPIAIASSLLPTLLRLRSDTSGRSYRAGLQRYYDVSVGFAYFIAIPISLTAPWLIELAYGQEFRDAAPILAVHVWGNVFVFLGVARGQFLINERLQPFILKATLLGAGVNVLLNLLLIPRWQGLGAAIATLIAQMVAAWLSSFASAAVRPTAFMQTKALFVPFRCIMYER